ncbi:acetyl-CoA carboxylase biotin carboxyl carrier protein [Nocardioides oleivorans]|uniref:Biotin carboxyl carrier protein of acetyl-CoA carboxylase n=1 Tax=Nocardioides oleivorans TaxID=273676 RepID=A0A4Q2RV77_9ACTN|nr:acetyl-CoA carboxylase biotin carboxyl carrier protein [Nocardioides oleivorans]RYB93070.1 acetyl-CoA carboxylase biotin carboxyl carrier protein [Nocardioides oleivorans]
MAKTSGKASHGLTFDTVVELLTMLDGSDLPTRVVYKDGPLRLEVERGTTRSAAPAAVAVPAPAPAAAAPAPVAVAAAPVAPAEPAPVPAAPTSEGRGDPVAAPIAGVFYRAPSPDAPPFVEVGQQVAADDVIGIVEVMKLMNTVRAGVAGTVVEVCVADAELVEFEQVLVRIEA